MSKSQIRKKILGIRRKKKIKDIVFNFNLLLEILKKKGVSGKNVGGFYDRYIKKIKKIKKVVTIGFAFPFQEVKKIPTNNFDVKLDFILVNNKAL